MIRLLRFLLTGDWHMRKWEIMSQCPRNWRGSKVGNFHDCRRSACGKIKEFKT